MTDAFDGFRAIQREVHECAQVKGWYDGSTERNEAELIALMHSELSDAAAYLGLDVVGAMRAKMIANWKREPRHGGKAF